MYFLDKYSPKSVPRCNSRTLEQVYGKSKGYWFIQRVAKGGEKNKLLSAPKLFMKQDFPHLAFFFDAIYNICQWFKTILLDYILNKNVKKYIYNNIIKNSYIN